MNISFRAKAIRSRISDWWHDKEDERLEELVADDYHYVEEVAEETGVTAYQLVNKASNNRKAS